MKLAFTICTLNYLAQAKTLGDSIIKHNPDFKFIIGVINPSNEAVEINYFLPHQILEIDKIQLPWLDEMIGRYTLFQLCCALKPFITEYILENMIRTEVVLYFDSDIMVFNPFTDLLNILNAESIVLTPHFLTPNPEYTYGLEQNILNAGIYNGGFFATNASEEAFAFLKWWKERMRYKCLEDTCNGLYVDQLWLNLVPIFFKKVHVMRDPGYNAAYWNLHEREIHAESKRLLVNYKYPLVFFHFSGYTVAESNIISKFNTSLNFDNRPDLLDLFNIYKTSLIYNRYYDLQKMKTPEYSVKQESEKKPINMNVSIFRKLVNAFRL